MGTRGESLAVAWLPTSDGVRLSIVGPVSEVDSSATVLPETWTQMRTVIADREMVEVLVA